MDEAQGFLVNTVIDGEVKLLEPKIIMTAEKAGRSTPMACGIMVVKSIGTQQLNFLGNCRCRLNFLDNMHIEARGIKYSTTYILFDTCRL